MSREEGRRVQGRERKRERKMAEEKMLLASKLDKGDMCLHDLCFYFVYIMCGKLCCFSVINL